MRQATRTARHDPALGLEAYCLRGLDRPFPCHLHGHYVLGVVERGTRTLTCGGRRETIRPGDVLLFNPGDSHGCVQEDGALDYRGLNIPRGTMESLAEETTGRRVLPGFDRPVVRDRELARRLRDELDVREICTGHCTGAPAYALLAEELGDRLRPLTTGAVFEYPD